MFLDAELFCGSESHLNFKLYQGGGKSTKLSVMKSFSFLIIESTQVCGECEGDGML